MKVKLKAAREAITKKDFNLARDSATTVLEYEPDNYNAYVLFIFSLLKIITFCNASTITHRNVFLGLALFELGNLEQSEQVTEFDPFLTALSDQLLRHIERR